jgi:PAS domain S-box-containing protein
MSRRVPISRKVLIVYATTLLPLAVIATFVFAAWFNASTRQLLDDRISNARLTATTLQTLEEDLVSISGFTGREIVDNRYGQPRARRVLAQLVLEQPLHDASLADSSGTIVYSSDPRLVGRSFAGNPALALVQAGRDSAVGPSEPIGDTSAFPIAHRLRFWNTSYIAVSRVDVDRLAERLPASVTMGGTHIIDSSGHVVFESEFPWLAQQRAYWGGVPYVRDALLGKQTQTLDFVFPVDHRRRIAAAVPISDWGWEAGASVDFVQATAPFRTSLAESLAISFIVVLAGLALGITMTRSILAGLGRLTGQSELLAGGDLSPQPPARTGDEIEDLSRTVEVARAALASYVSGLAALAAAGRSLSESLALPDVTSAIIDGAEQLFGAKTLWIFRPSPESGDLETFLWHAEIPGPQPELHIPPGKSVAGKVFTEGRIAIVPDVRAVPDFIDPAVTDRFGIVSLAEMPLVAHDRTIGVLGISAPGIEQWVEGGREASLLAAFAGQASVSLENARLYDELRQTADQLHITLAELRTVITSAPTAIIGLDEEGRVLTWNPASEKMFGWTTAEVVGRPLPTVPDDERNEFDKILAATRRGETVTDRHQRRSTKDGRVLDVSISASPLYDEHGSYRGPLAITTDITERLRAERRLRESEAQFRAVVEQSKDGISMGTPDGRVLLYNAAMERITGYPMAEVNAHGWFDLAFPEEHEREQAVQMAEKALRGEPGYAEVRIRRKDGSPRWVAFSLTPVVVDHVRYDLGILSDIDERKRFEREREKSSRLAAQLNEINIAINAVLDFDEIMRPVLGMASRALELDAGIVLLWEDGRWVPRFVHNLPVGVLGSRLTDAEAPLAAFAATSPKPAAVTDTRTDPRWRLTAVDLGVRGAVAAPLVIRGETTGVLALASTTGPCSLDPIEVDFVAKVAAAVSSALENARLYDEERTIADTLQEAILAMPESIPGVRFGSLYRSGTAAAQVGGDFYDIFELEHRRVGVVVGDVSGKGLRAASLTSLAKNTVRAYAYGGDPPAEALRKTNDIVYQSVSAATFLTIVFAVLDVETGSLVYSNAGHPAGLLLRCNGAVDELPANSVLLGAFPEVVFSESTTHLAPGDTLLLFTDGITEARRGTELFGEERVRRWMAENGPRLDPENLPSALLDHVSAFAEGRLSDDVAVLALSPAQQPVSRTGM